MREVNRIEMAGETTALRGLVDGQVKIAVHFKTDEYTPALETLTYRMLDEIAPPKRRRLRIIEGGACVLLLVTAALLEVLRSS